jgi:hypothetical protein
MMNVRCVAVNEWAMLGWIRGFFRRDERIPPLMVRALTRTQTPEVVSVQAVWFPSGMRRAYRARSAQGLCMLPWVARAERVELRVQANGIEKAIEVGIDDARTGRAIELALG